MVDGKSIDRENAITNLEQNIRWIEDNEHHQFPGWGNVVVAMRDAVELLKEQPKIVRCKDCIYWNGGYMNYDIHPWLPCMDMNTKRDYFCPDGERR